MESEIRRQLANAKNELDNLGATCQEVKNSLILLKVDLTFYPGPCGTRIDNPLERFIQRYGYWTVERIEDTLDIILVALVVPENL